MTQKICPRCGSADVRPVGTNWRCASCKSTKGMTLDEITQRETREAAALETMLGAQGGRCGACGQDARRSHHDGDREVVLCRSCHLLIEDARERHETPELAAEWLRAVAQYLTRTEGA